MLARKLAANFAAVLQYALPGGQEHADLSFQKTNESNVLCLELI